MKKMANFSPDRKYRYQLWRVWDVALPRIVFIMLNPSKANECIDDPTVAKCIRLAKKWGYGSLEVLNIFALCSTDPRELKKEFKRGGDPVGRMNDEIILTRMLDDEVKLVVCAWGNGGTFLDRDFNLVRSIEKMTKRELFCLCKNPKTGTPSHPLYLSEELKPVRFSI